MTVVLVAEYFAIRGRALRLAHFYINNATSGYWYTASCSFCAFVAWAIELRRLLPGLVGTMCSIPKFSSQHTMVKVIVFFGFTVAFVVRLGDFPGPDFGYFAICQNRPRRCGGRVSREKSNRANDA